MSANYRMGYPSQVISGAGCIGRLGDILTERGAQSVLVVTGPRLAQSESCRRLKESLPVGVRCTVYSQVPNEPSDRAVDDMLAAVAGERYDMVIALGGGSVMDAAKLCSLLIGTGLRTRQLAENPDLAQKQIPSVMIPTTCGTGSEATCNAIVLLPEQNVKVGIVSRAMLPDYVLLDPETLAALPERTLASSAIDALAHCVECYTSNKANPLSDLYAREGARLLFQNLLAAYRDPENAPAKQRLLYGAFYGGLAISGSGTTAVHALSYPLGGRFHVAHGVANALLFAPVMRVNMAACGPRLTELCDGVWPQYYDRDASWKAAYLVEQIEELARETRIPATMRELGVTEADVDWLVENGSRQKRLLDNNPKVLSLEEIRGIYLQVL